MRRPPDVEQATVIVPRLLSCRKFIVNLIKGRIRNYRLAIIDMRLNKLLCLASVLLLTNVQAQDLKILVDKKGKIGFADQNGNEVIKCQYESAQPFTNGTAIVTKSGKSGIIDATGRVLLPLKYSQILTWNKELYIIKDGKKMGLSSHQGNIVLPVNYSHISKLNCFGKALIALGGKATANEKKSYMNNAKYGIIDAKGNILVTPKYKGLYEFSYECKDKHPYDEGKRLRYSYHNTVDTLETDCSYLGFSGNGSSIYKAGVMDGNGKELMKAGLYDIVLEPQNGMVRYYIIKKKQTLCGYHNLTTGKGFEVSKFDTYFDNINFWTHGDFIGDIAPVNGSSWTFINKEGNTLRSGFTSIKHSQTTGLWAAKNGSGKWDVFNDANNMVDALSGFEDIRFPEQEGDKEVFSVLKNDKYGCINRTGEEIVPFEYEQALSNTYDVIAVKKNGKWGALSASNTQLIPNEYANILLPSERNAKHFWVMKADSLYYHLNISTHSLSSIGYKVAINFEKELAYVVPQNMKVEDNQINRAQIYEPNTDKATIDAINMSEHIGAFVNIINANDEVVFDLPVSTLYADTVRKEIEKRDNCHLSATEKKNLLLYITRENRSYDLKSKLSEEEWNY